MKILFWHSLILPVFVIFISSGCNKESPAENTTTPIQEETVWRPTKDMWYLDGMNNISPHSGFTVSDSGFSISMVPAPNNQLESTALWCYHEVAIGEQIKLMNKNATHAKLYYTIQFNPYDLSHTKSFYAMCMPGIQGVLIIPEWLDSLHTVYSAFYSDSSHPIVEYNIPDDCLIRKNTVIHNANSPYLYEPATLKDGEILVTGLRFHFQTYDPNGYKVYSGIVSVTSVRIELY